VVLVLDTNVVVSGVLSPYGPPGRLVDMLVSGRLRLAFDDRMFAELREVLLRPRFGLTGEYVDDLLSQIEDHGIAVSAQPLAAEWPDPDDAPFVEVAATLGVSLVTGDAALAEIARAVGVTVLTPREGLDLLSGRMG
jgi:putative PIN family toxin of toxin-antitoxin system